MQVATAQPLMAAEPGTTVDVVVDVVNTSELIDGVTARVIGLPEAVITCDPQLLPLFPEASGQLRVSIQVPSTTPAGVHPLSVEVHSHAGTGTRHLDLDLSVAAHPALELRVDPPRVRARRSGQFLLHVQNSGNTTLAMSLGAQREDRRAQVSFTPDEFTAEPGTSVPVIMRVKGPRMITGAEVERRVTVEVTARRVHVIAAMLDTEPEPELLRSSVVTLRQRPLIGRGVLTALILISIITLWALAFLLGLTQVFSSDALTKTAPTTFPTTVVGAESPSGDPGSQGGQGAGEDGQTVPGAAPPGALPKTGIVTAKVGGSISGLVSATTDGTPVGRIMVRAYRQGRNGPVLVSSAATQTDGTYVLAGLFPTDYRLKFSAAGFTTVWYPAASARGGSTPVTVDVQTPTTGVNATVTGLPATISGTIEASGAVDPPITTVTARLLGGNVTDTTATTSADATVAARATSDASGAWKLDDLASPATYELSFQAPGYQVTKVLTKVNGGEQRIQAAVVPGAVSGSIQGTVVSQNAGVGNVIVSTQVNGETVAVTTPTVGAVGAFRLDNLPTPGTYVLTFSAEDHGSTTTIVDLAAGDSRSGLRVDLAAGSGTVTGRVTAADATGLGGVKVTLGGASSQDGPAPTTVTLTSGDVGTYTLNGLTAGDYTLTFEREGYAPETVPVSLSRGGAATGVDVVLGNEMGRITGEVRGPNGAAYVGATITVTDGQRIVTTTSTGTGGALPRGGFVVSGLAPGTYSVTATANGMRQQTAMVTVYAGINSIQKLHLRSS